MKIEDYEKAEDLLTTKNLLNRLYRIFSYPYPSIFSPLKRVSFRHEREEICFVSFDEKTQKELKTAIRDVIDKRLNEIDTEIENL